MKADEKKAETVAAPKRPSVPTETPFWVRLNNASRAPSARTTRRAGARAASRRGR